MKIHRALRIVTCTTCAMLVPYIEIAELREYRRVKPHNHVEQHQVESPAGILIDGVQTSAPTGMAFLYNEPSEVMTFGSSPPVRVPNPPPPFLWTVVDDE